MTAAKFYIFRAGTITVAPGFCPYGVRSYMSVFTSVGQCCGCGINCPEGNRTVAIGNVNTVFRCQNVRFRYTVAVNKGNIVTGSYSRSSDVAFTRFCPDAASGLRIAVKGNVALIRLKRQIPVNCYVII